MSYELTDILQRCEKADAEMIISTIDSYVNFSDDKGLKAMLARWTTGTMPLSLAWKLETELRYLGSSDIAYAVRKMRGLEPAGVSVEEMLEDISKVLKISYKKVGTLESRLERLAKNMFEKAFLSMTPEEQREILKKMDLTQEQWELLMDYIKKRGVKLVLPVLVNVIGPKATMKLMEAVIFSIITMFLGKEAARQLLKIIIARFPWLAGMGPVAVAALTGWTVVDLCGPAMRKTIPILLILSMVALRDGAEDADFWKDI